MECLDPATQSQLEFVWGWIVAFFHWSQCAFFYGKWWEGNGILGVLRRRKMERKKKKKANVKCQRFVLWNKKLSQG